MAMSTIGTKAPSHPCRQVMSPLYEVECFCLGPRCLRAGRHVTSPLHHPAISIAVMSSVQAKVSLPTQCPFAMT